MNDFYQVRVTCIYPNKNTSTIKFFETNSEIDANNMFEEYCKIYKHNYYDVTFDIVTRIKSSFKFLIIG
jgi:hypothetical protein